MIDPPEATLCLTPNLLASAASRHRRNLSWALALTTSFMAIEIVGGLWTGSLALLAIRFSERPRIAQKTYGYVRMEVLSALADAVVLLLTVYIFYEAYQRYLDPPEILGVPMLAVAAAGLVVNLISMRLQAAGSKESLNVKGAYFEVLGDMLGSLGVLAAAGIILFTGLKLADPLTR